MLSSAYGEAALSGRTCGISGHVSTPTARFNIHGAKVMICIWCDQIVVVYYELLKPSETIIWDRYRTQLVRLSRTLKEEQPQYQERHDNARPHIAKPVKTHLETLKWEVLPHSPYFPDVALSDYHLVRSMAHGLVHQHFRSYEEVKKCIESWIASKNA